MTRQGPHSLRGCPGAETTSARHRVVVSATLITNTKWWKGTMTAWDRDVGGRGGSYSMKRSACPRNLDCSLSVWDKQKGIFTVTNQWPLWGLRLHSLDYRIARVTVWNTEKSSEIVDFFLISEVVTRLFHLINKHNVRSLRCAERCLLDDPRTWLGLAWRETLALWLFV